MKVLYAGLLALATAGMVGCGDGGRTSSTPPPSGGVATAPQPVQTTTPAVNPGAPAASTDPSAGAEAGQGSGTVAVNPPHGQPGHSCDIPVGAPMSQLQNPAASTPAAAPEITGQQPGATTPPPAAATPAAPPAGARLNPPHGQPGHRCDIQVGAALP